MAATRFLPRRLDTAFSRLAGPESLKSILALGGGPEYVSYWDDFVGSPSGTWPDTANWSYPATVGTGTEVIGVTAARGGTLTCTTANTSGNGAYQYLGLNWRGTEGIYYVCRAKIDNVATAKFEIGLSDSLTGEGVVATKATPTFTATDGAVFVFDTADDTNVTFITANAGVVGANVDSSFTVVNDTFFIVEIVAQGGFAAGYLNGQYVGGGAITATAALTPGVGATTRAAATRTLTVDYQGCIGPRNAI